jgi:hypothetical protein
LRLPPGLLGIHREVRGSESAHSSRTDRPRIVGMGLKPRLLGPVAAWAGDRKIDLGPRKQRLVFAVLALEASRSRWRGWWI